MAEHRVTVVPYGDGDALHYELHVVCSAPECVELIAWYHRTDDLRGPSPWPTPADLLRVEQEHLSEMARAGRLGVVEGTPDEPQGTDSGA